MASDFDWFPAHKCGLYLSHNQHRDYYQTVQQWDEDYPHLHDWVSDEEKARAYETGECWTLQWYPSTPIGFFNVAASSLDALRAHFADASE